MSAWRIGLLAVALAAAAPSAAEASVMSTAAAALPAGKYVAINTGLTGADLMPDGSGGSLLDWADSGAWDPTQRRFVYIGKKAGCSNNYYNIIYDENANSWSYGTVPIGSGCGHGYDGNTAGPGVQYFHPYGSTKIHRNTGSGWTSLADLPTPNTGIAGIARGPNGLLYADKIWDVWYPDGGAKVQVNVGVTYPTFPPIGDYHSIAEYDPVHDVYLVGGGNGSRAIYRVAIVAGVPVRTRMGNAPFDFGVGEYDQHTNVTADPVTGEFIVYKKQTGIFYSYNIMTDTWRQIGVSGDGNMPPLPVGQNTSPVAAGIGAYGVIMYVAQNNTAAYVYLYKHAPAGPADNVPPNRPGQLLAR
jgi:hypothetical protein